MSEQTMRQRVVRCLREWDAISVENPAYPGTPDVNYREGWIELKCMRRWPRNADTSPVLIDHFTPQQRVWLARRSRKGGNVHLMLQVGQEFLLFEGAVAAAVVGKATRPELYANTVRHWGKGLNEKEFRACLYENLKNCQRASGC
jgi:hypothetical protein